MSEKASIKCPQCGNNINVNEILYRQLESEISQKNQLERKKIEEDMERQKEEYKKAFELLDQEKENIKKQKERIDEEISKEAKNLLKQEKQKLADSIRKEINDDYKEMLDLLQKELTEKSNQVKELNKSKAEIEKLKREKEEVEAKIQAENEIKFSKLLQEEKIKIQKTVDEKNELKFREQEEKLEQLKKQLQEAQRKMEQGSQQLQGEIQELAIEEFLKNKYPFDTIEEIAKGAKGGDCIQIIHTREVQNCGKIYYESKRTKEFKREWIGKFKTDIINKGADAGILVTEVLPKELDRMGLIDGIWVCTYEEFKALSSVIRDSIIKINQAKKSQENKTDKMSLLYKYLTSTEFKMQIETIVEGFTQMQKDLESEKRSIQRIWKQREKQLEQVLENSINMYGSIKGIAGNSIASINVLELPYSIEEN
ncbi:DUF2130 domain-containing protein [Campylobacter lari]|uniref:DUF2130 domain-containing protein n=1 Tax=Campylobacter sp. CNRCH_2016_0050h TaxID=2911608 RepID=UPI0014069CCF|nr:DUF2130 domain-containing protein [Campylobacter sp. CNRCH_2016_0050h]EAK0436969.1 DUF2130 domain-containing protein [Campylobacter lari]MCV3457098.1 DUF2130 domain-containing protein [Campylobacter sp. CNRCH_2016_0050h]